MKKLLALTFALALLAGCGGDSDADKASGESEPEVETVTVTGTLTLREFPGNGASYADRETKGSLCWGSGGYSDIKGGAAVVIRDSSGDQVGLGALEPGQSTEDGRLPYCEFPFKVEGIPEGDGMLTIEVGSRGQVPFERSEADRVQIGIG